MKPKYVSSVAKLAIELGYAHSTVSDWMNTRPDAPKPTEKGHDVTKWKRYLKNHPELGMSKARQIKSSDKALHDARRIAAIADREEFRLAVQKKQYIKSELVARIIEEMESTTTQILRQQFEHQLPADAVGQEIETIRSLCRKSVDIVCAQRQEAWKQIGKLIK